MQSYRFKYNGIILPFMEKIREEFRLNRENLVDFCSALFHFQLFKNN